MVRERLAAREKGLVGGHERRDVQQRRHVHRGRGLPRLDHRPLPVLQGRRRRFGGLVGAAQHDLLLVVLGGGSGGGGRHGGSGSGQLGPADRRWPVSPPF